MIRNAVLFALVVVLSSGVVSAQDKEKKKGRRGGGRLTAERVMARYKAIELSEEQKGKIKETVKKFSGPMAELQKKSQSLITPEMRKARREAMQKARAEGLKGKELREAVEKAAPVDEEVAAKMKEMQSKMAAMQKEMREALDSVLTDEQKAKLKKRGENAKKGKRKKKKDDN